MAMLLRLEVPAAVALLAQVFPPSSDPTAGHDFAEPAGPRAADGYVREQQEIAQPLTRLFALVREISVALAHEAGAFG
jgi:phosphoenolpyruvate carboxylase